MTELRRRNLIDTSQPSIITSGVTNTPRKKIDKARKIEARAPNDLCRISPWFPVNRNQPIEDVHLKIETSWGKIIIDGPMLNLVDEDVFYSLLFLRDQYGTDSFITSIHEICEVRRVKPNSQQYESIWKSLYKLNDTRLIIMGHRFRLRGHLILLIGDDIEKQRVAFQLNKTLVDSFNKATGWTKIDLEFRRSLKGSISKCLYRFVSSHESFYKGGLFCVDLVKLCKAINVVTEEVPNYKLRNIIKSGCVALQEKNFLSAFRIDKNANTVWLWKGDEVDRQRKRRKKIIKALGIQNRDEYLKVIKAFKHLWTEYALCGIEPKSWSHKDEECFVKAAKKLIEFMRRHRKKLLLSNREKEQPQRTVRYVFEAIEAHENGNWIRVTPHWLCNDITYDRTLPISLNDQAIVRDGYEF
jgi:hypothetical protein